MRRRNSGACLSRLVEGEVVHRLSCVYRVKGRNFSIKTLFNGDEKLASLFGAKPSLAIMRLAPQDYHRFHAPVSGTVGPITHVKGEFYTVNATVINEDFDVVCPLHYPTLCASSSLIALPVHGKPPRLGRHLLHNPRPR